MDDRDCVVGRGADDTAADDDNDDNDNDDWRGDVLDNEVGKSDNSVEGDDWDDNGDDWNDWADRADRDDNEVEGEEKEGDNSTEGVLDALVGVVVEKGENKENSETFWKERDEGELKVEVELELDNDEDEDEDGDGDDNDSDDETESRIHFKPRLISNCAYSDATWHELSSATNRARTNKEVEWMFLSRASSPVRRNSTTRVWKGPQSMNSGTFKSSEMRASPVRRSSETEEKYNVLR